MALAAIQGLDQNLNEKDAEIEALMQSVADLQELVQSLADKKWGVDDTVNSVPEDIDFNSQFHAATLHFIRV